MIDNELRDILVSVSQRKLGQALRRTENYLLTHPRQRDMDRLQVLKSDYGLMADYWQRGYPDPARKEVYDQLLRRLYELVTDMNITFRIRNTAYIMSIYSRARNNRKNWSISSLRQDMESYTSDVALLELEPVHTRQEKSRQLHEQHQRLMCDLFDYIWTSHSWRENMEQAFRDILLSPTIDSRDQQLIVSAVMLSAMNAFDICKFRLLTDVYRQSSDEQVRQRALVGWVLSMNRLGGQLFIEERQLIAQLVADEQCRRELKELQMQMVYCMNAESDNQKIQSEIMPDILKNSNFRITRNGIEEKEEDPMDDILHPEASEQAIERVEESFRKMMDMQKQGSDIYFGGFSQMKRFPFFNDICNWFIPFYIDHPALGSVAEKLRNNKFLQGMMQNGPFCNSDKYSFMIAFDQVLNRIPQSMREMMERGEAVMENNVGNLEQQTPAYIRRMYLQDLYRFFRLHPQRSDFSNPFASDDSDRSCNPFVGNPLLHGLGLEELLADVAAFLMKHKMTAEASYVLENYSVELRDYSFYMMVGRVLTQHPDYSLNYSGPILTAEECFERATILQPKSERALLGYARALFAENMYEEAAEAYDRLMLLNDENKSYQLNKAVCLTHLARYEEAEKLLYRLNYNYPDDVNVNRVLAWTLVGDGKYPQAVKLYDQLLAFEHPAADDLLNYGYCLWFSGEVVSAVSMFRQFMDLQSDDFSIEDEFMKVEYDLIAAQGIDDTEIQLMLDQLQ